jgi:hypothetical protein
MPHPARLGEDPVEERDALLTTRLVDANAQRGSGA